MKRNPRKVKWTKAFRKAAGKEMIIVSLCNPTRVAPLTTLLCAGLYFRVRKAKKYPCSLRSGPAADNDEGHETCGGDQGEARSTVLQEQASRICTLVSISDAHCASPLQQDSNGARKEPKVTTSEETRYREAGCRLRAFHRALTTHRVDFPGKGEDQSARHCIQKEICPDTRRWTIYGNGRRLGARAFVLLVVSLRIATSPSLPSLLSIAILYIPLGSLMVMISISRVDREVIYMWVNYSESMTTK